MPHTIKKMSLIGLILMIFTSVFGFANSPSAYYLMGYSAIPFYIFSALLFFIPFALMMAEMGAAYRKEEGGIYSWMNNSVGPRFAFIGTFMWFSSYIIPALAYCRTGAYAGGWSAGCGMDDSGHRRCF